MKRERSQGFLTAADGVRLHWQSDLIDDPRALIILLHGLGEHKGRYDHVIEALTGAGYGVYSIDLRGHGRSEGPRAVVERYDEFMDDLGLFYSTVITPNLDRRPLVVLGHSMGGNLALGYTLRNQSDVAALALSGPLLVPGSDVNAVAKAAVGVIARLSPRIGLQRLDADAISQDPQVVAAYRTDPLVYHGRVSAGIGNALLTEISNFPARYPELKIPVLVMHGTADRLTDPAGSHQLAAEATNAVVTAHFYEGNFHEIFNEPNRDEVIADLVEWLDTSVG